jgi:hypothetical protein
MCEAFDRFVNGRSWGKSPRQPSTIVTSLVGLRHKAQVHQDLITLQRARRKAKNAAKSARCQKRSAPPSESKRSQRGITDAANAPSHL